MPVRSLDSPVIKWPDKSRIDKAFRQWISGLAVSNKALIGAGYYGSYARGDWGVGSDLDIILIVDSIQGPKNKRNLSWDCSSLPVAVDLTVYTKDEWEQIRQSDSKLANTLRRQIVWAKQPQL